MSSEHRIADVSDFDGNPSRVIAHVEGQEIAVFRVDGEFYAVANFCPHQSGPLCEGPLNGQMEVADNGWDWVYDDTPKVITCPWHGWRFDVTTGSNTQDDRYAVPTYEVTVRDGEVYVRR